MKEQKWISVEDELPEEEGWYLVYDADRTVSDDDMESYAIWCFVRGGFEYMDCFPNITHWMLLPDPPEQE